MCLPIQSNAGWSSTSHAVIRVSVCVFLSILLKLQFTCFGCVYCAIACTTLVHRTIYTIRYFSSALFSLSLIYTHIKFIEKSKNIPCDDEGTTRLHCVDNKRLHYYAISTNFSFCSSVRCATRLHLLWQFTFHHCVFEPVCLNIRLSVDVVVISILLLTLAMHSNEKNCAADGRTVAPSWWNTIFPNAMQWYIYGGKKIHF